jgi:hydrogenase maturation protein HypF
VTGADRPGDERLRLHVRGAVQGVGFRPFVYRLATGLGLRGWVINDSSGVVLEVEGPPEPVAQFRLRVEQERPPRAVVQGIESARLDPVGYTGFEIRESEGGDRTVLVLPDIATCPDCLADIRDPGNRRYRYAFTNCTNCGPRFTIVEALPYDRSRTTLARFAMCADCRAEYEDPFDRRFHAQPNACPACGPSLTLLDPSGRPAASGDEALRCAAGRLAAGAIVAVKGVGGFHLMADARNADAIARLRTAKGRKEKPFALMFPSLAALAAECRVSPLEEQLLGGAEAPIVLLDRRASPPRAGAVCEGVAPGHPALGAMLPSNPLHHLLMDALGFPVVATSGNLSDEPICTDNLEALDRLAGLADHFLVHDRPIARHVDDSIVRVVLGRELLLRRSRGYAPLPVRVKGLDRPVLAVGPHLKSSVALSVGENVFVSQHLGDLETEAALAGFTGAIDALQRLYDTVPAVVACDAHPDYLSTRFARDCGRPCVEVQHHVAHAIACLAENEIEEPALGVSWDGTGYGPDGTVWGGEFFAVRGSCVRRVAWLRPFPLPGGERAVREPRRCALGLLHAMGVGAARSAGAFTVEERRVLEAMLARGVQAPLTTSAGRLFDAVASLVGLRQRMFYEGQAAMELEFAAAGFDADGAYVLPVVPASPERPGGPPWVLDWEPMVRALLDDVAAGVPSGLLAARFHQALADGIVSVARLAGEPRVALSGGCFQNRRLLELTVGRLRDEGFRPCWHQRLPPNDGGVSVGQLVAAARGIRLEAW